MERVCSQCHAIAAEEFEGDWCPACGGALIEQSHPVDASSRPAQPPAEIDHRGIVLPRRHAAGGIITPY